MQVEIDKKQFEAKLAKLVKRHKDLSPVFVAIGEMFRQSRKTIFKLKGRGGYKDLSPRYKKRKEKKFNFIYPILKASGHMEKSIISKSHAKNITIVSKRDFAFGTRVPYAKYHNSDKPRTKSSRIPLRKFIFWGPEAPRRVRKQTNDVHKFSGRAIQAIKAFITTGKIRGGE